MLYNISFQTLSDIKLLHVRFDKVEAFVRAYGGTRYLVLFGSEKYNKVRHLIELKSGIIYGFSHNYARIKIDWYDSLPLEVTLTFHNVIIHIKLVLSKDEIHYYYEKFLEKGLY